MIEKGDRHSRPTTHAGGGFVAVGLFAAVALALLGGAARTGWRRYG